MMVEWKEEPMFASSLEHNKINIKSFLISLKTDRTNCTTRHILEDKRCRHIVCEEK